MLLCLIILTIMILGTFVLFAIGFIDCCNMNDLRSAHQEQVIDEIPITIVSKNSINT